MKRDPRLYIVIIITVSIFVGFFLSSGIYITTTGDYKDFNGNSVEISVTWDCQDFVMGFSQMEENNTLVLLKVAKGYTLTC